MKIKFNWGTGIVIAIVVMVLFISSLVFVATKQSFHLVEDDYYEQGIKFQEHIEKRKNTNSLTEQLIVKEGAKNLELVFPSQFLNDSIKGTIHFYSPIDKSLDIKKEINVNEHLFQEVDIQELKMGRYTLKVDWEAANNSYYHEQNIQVR